MLVMYLKNIDVWFQTFGVLDGMLVKFLLSKLVKYIFEASPSE
jgi:hypothetical protein